MKTYILIIMLFAAGYIFSQADQDSTGRKTEKENTVSQTADDPGQKGKGFKGEKDGMRKNKDVFIDKDGDGICDSRQGGMSFGKMRRRMGDGKSGPDAGGGKNRYGGGK